MYLSNKTYCRIRAADARTQRFEEEQIMRKVKIRREKVVIPTYEIADYDKNPMFLEKRVYQGSSGRVYPHPVCEGVSDEKTFKEYDAVFLENEYIQVMILPEIGGRIQRLYDKTNGKDAVYYNEVIKPALVGLAGPWISGGIEFNWPQHHRPSTFDPVDCVIKNNDDGSVTVWCGETEKMFHTHASAGFTVYPDKAYVEIKGQVYNPTDIPQTFLWWANPAVAVNDYTQSVFPPDVNAVMDHGKRDVSKFPIADGIYYKVNYAPGTDISRYKNIPVPTSYMAYHSDYDFIGNYDYSSRAGLLHVADHHVSPGKKQWTWGCGDFGKAWDRNLTDKNGPYIELMTGMFTDNQPDFTYLKPYEEKRFVQYFMPYKSIGAVKCANEEVAVNLEQHGDAVYCAVYSPAEIGSARVEITRDGETVYSEDIDLNPKNVYEKFLEGEKCEGLTITVYSGDRKLVSFASGADKFEPVPQPAQAIPKPSELETNEKLFLAAVHLEQYRHATRSPEPYYLEGLRRDPSDIRLNNGYGKYLYGKGLFEESESCFRAAIKSSVWKNPNPYDCEPYYNLGLALEAQGDEDGAFDAYYKAVWDGNMQNKAYYRLACLASKKGKYSEALEYVDQSLMRGMNNYRARAIKTAFLRILHRDDEARSFAKETHRMDPLNHAGVYELAKLGVCERDTLWNLMRGDNHNYIELALVYAAAGLYYEAEDVLRNAPCDEPMVHYYLYKYTGDASELEKAENASSLYCFPNRLEDIAVLKNAIDNGGKYAAYYLGCLYYDRGRWQDAEKLWESVAEKITLPTVHRNLALAYYNKEGDPKKAKKEMEKAFSMDESDARVFYEYDQLLRMMDYTTAQRLKNMEDHAELLPLRDDLYTEYITLLNINGEYNKAYDLMMNHKFHPWEGGEGKITAQYRTALMGMADKAERAEAERYLVKALEYPHNLGEGKLAGCMDNDIYYRLGKIREGEASQEAYKLAMRGGAEITRSVYYNDQPPEMLFYAALALKATGKEEEAKKRFESFIEFGEEHMNDKTEIDYFAVSLPDFLIFEADLDKKNKVHCLFMKSLGYFGLGDKKKAELTAKEAQKLEPSHCGVNALLKMIKK